MRGPIALLLIALSTAISITEFNTYEKEGTTFTLNIQDQNRQLLEGLRSAQPELKGAKAVLVLGLEAIFHPWQHPDFLVADLRFTGIWYFPPAPLSHIGATRDRVELVDVKNTPLRQYDAILCFNSKGQLVSKYDRAQTQALDRFSGIDPDDLRAVLCAPATLQKLLAFPEQAKADELVSMALELHTLACHDLTALYLEKMFALGPVTDPYPYFYLGREHVVRKRYAKALECFERAVQYDNPANPNRYFKESLEELRQLMAAAK